MTAIYRFGRFELRPSTRQVLVDNQPAPLGARAFDVLLALIERRERLVTKNELLDLVWPALVVEENNLQVQVSALRKLLGQDAIATVAGRGYRFALETEHDTVEARISTMTPTSNLPQQISSFVGRDREIAEVQSLLERMRLLTLLGMGGIGKTRLALQIASNVLDAYPDGAWFVDLGSVRESSRVASETARVLGVREEPGTPITETLCANLKARKLLLILDNCEHLIQESADLANSILRSARDVRVIATSRAALHVPGEQVYPVLPLPVPDRNDGLEALSRSTAVRLFVERAQSHKPAFALTEREAPAVAELVTQLEGIPLALELAAARVRATNVTEINARLKDRYQLLTDGGRAQPERHQTLRALVDWSYDLLTPSERTMLNWLTVFVGGFEMEAAEQVCGAEPLEPLDVFDLVTSLVDKSLVMTDEREQGTRYRMLETIRDYAREKLEQAGDLALASARHCQHYFSFAKAVRIGIQGPEEPTWLTRMEAELDNVRAGIALALAGGVDPIIAAKYVVAMHGFWTLRGYTTEGRNTVRAVLQLAAVRESSLAEGHALYVGAALALDQSDYIEAGTMLERCLTLRRATGGPIELAATLSLLSMTRLATGDAETARECDKEALAVFREQGNRVGEAIVRLHLADIEAWVGDDVQARVHLDTCQQLARQLGSRETEAECELAIGRVEFECGALDRARERFHRSITICQARGDKRGEAVARWWLAKVDLADLDIESASNRLDAAVLAFRDFGLRREMLGCLEDHARLAQAQGRIGDAVRLAAAVAHHYLDLIRPPRDERRWQAQLDSLRQATTSEAFDTAWNDGQTWLVDYAMRMAMSKPGDPIAD